MSVLNITNANFEAEVLNSEKPVLLDFWASWCGPCKMIAPIVHEIAEERPDIKVGKINVDEEMKLAMKFGIQSIPTLIVIKDKKAVAQSVGYQSKEQILSMLED
ncbi:MAG: thioredoxin [Clostridia bacterium]|nr:thioredoxin [Clostridia bacterium]